MGLNWWIGLNEVSLVGAEVQLASVEILDIGKLDMYIPVLENQERYRVDVLIQLP